MADSYDIASVCHLIRERGFTAVVLQVPDENLSDAADLYAEINKAIPDLDLYLTADSTYGSSVDDVSALHVDGKLLVYFGSDMSVSGSMPVVVCPRRAVLDIPAVASALREEFTKVLAGNDKNVLLLVEPAYFHLIVEIEEAFRAMIPSIIVGKVPACADPKNWMVEKDLRATIASQYDLIGSMLVPKDIVVDDLVVCIISDKRDQIVNSCLRYSNNDVVCYSPAEQRIFSNKGVVLQEYRERFLGVSRVKDASVIGLIVGSMGLSGQVIQVTVARLQALIQAAGKTSYCFVMGRLNESKLRNFPEVDVFCLVANDDTALISPKTFHIPVVTPYELELGLGAREWTSNYVVGGFAATQGSSPEVLGAEEDAFQQMLQRVREARSEEEVESDPDEPNADNEGLGSTEDATVDQLSSKVSQALSVPNTEKRLAVHFESAAADFLQSRDYQGMDFTVPQDAIVGVQTGQFGTASSGYKSIALELPQPSESVK